MASRNPNNPRRDMRDLDHQHSGNHERREDDHYHRQFYDEQDGHEQSNRDRYDQRRERPHRDYGSSAPDLYPHGTDAERHGPYNRRGQFEAANHDRSSPYGHPSRGAYERGRTDWQDEEGHNRRYESGHHAAQSDDMGYGRQAQGRPQIDQQSFQPRDPLNGEYGWGYGKAARGTSFRGVGPKGYERSDDRLKELICERLSDDEDIDASDIEVQISKGEVTLEGLVDDRTTKYHVESLIDCFGGVKEIHNRLRMRDRNGPTSQKPNHNENQGGPKTAGQRYA